MVPAEPPHPNYQLGGTQALSNGLLGSDTRYGDGEWLGWWGKDVVLTIDLEKAQSIDTLQMRFFQSKGQWIYLPASVQVFFSKNGVDFKALGSKAVPGSDERVLH
ncbi:MAG: beta-N-acetylhexosaminidase, partial [Saprospirales bacterium]|nr:beta-N-acetylhexosaminidase [Saprospirales bacterium]